jgi:hypothetical protein
VAKAQNHQPMTTDFAPAAQIIGQQWLVPVRLGRKGAAPGTSLMFGLDCHERHAAPKTMRLSFDNAKHDTISYTNRSALSYRDIVRYRDMRYDCCDIPHPDGRAYWRWLQLPVTVVAAGDCSLGPWRASFVIRCNSQTRTVRKSA